MKIHASRRRWLKNIQSIGMLALGSWFSPLTVFAKKEDAAKAIQEITGGKPIIDGKVKLVIPPLVENGNLVVLKLSVDSPMTPNDYVKSVHVIAEGNPLPNIFTVYFTPRSGTANITTRVRLADSQTVWAIAHAAKPKKIVISKAEADLANKAGVSTKLLALQKLKTMKLTSARRAEIERQIKAELDIPTPAVDIDKAHKQPELQGTDKLLAERGDRYGKFTGHAKVTQILKNVLSAHAKSVGTEFAFDQAEALDMICHKLGRIVNGDPHYADSWVDIAGYAKLVSDRLEGVAR